MFPKYDFKILIISLSIVIFSGIMLPILSYPLDFSIILSILLTLGETIAFWGLILLLVNLVLRFDRKRRDYKFKEFGMTSGISFLPLLIYNISIPILTNVKAENLALAWDINLIRVTSMSDSFQFLFLLSKLITIFCVFFFIVLMSISIRDTFNLELIKAIYLCIFVVILAFLLTNWIFTGSEVLIEL